MRNATPRQIKAICWNLKEADVPYMAGTLDWFHEKLTFSNANTIVGHFMNNRFDQGLAELQRINPLMFPKTGDCNGCGSDHDPHACPKI